MASAARAPLAAALDVGRLGRAALRARLAAPVRLVSTGASAGAVPPPPPPVAKPRPITSSGSGGGGGGSRAAGNGDVDPAALLGAGGLVAAALAGYEAYARWGSGGAVVPPSARLGVALDTLREALGALPTIADPDPAAFAALLPPWAARTASRRYTLGSPTVVLALEGVVCDTVYDPRVGHRLVLRPGLPELLEALAASGAEVVLWSRRSDSAAAEAALVAKLVDELVARDKQRYADFCAAVDRQAKVTKAMELAAAHKEGRPPRALKLREHYFDGEKREMFVKEALGIAGVLGREHSYRSGSGANGGKGDDAVLPVHLLGRPLSSVLLVDASPAQKAALPRVPTLLLSPFAVAADPRAPGAVSYKEDDPSLDLAVKMLQYYDTARGMWHRRLEAAPPAQGRGSASSPQPGDSAEDGEAASDDRVAGAGRAPGSSIGAFYAYMVGKAEQGRLMPWQRRLAAAEAAAPAPAASGANSPTPGSGGPAHPPIDETVGVFSVVLRMMAEEARLQQQGGGGGGGGHTGGGRDDASQQSSAAGGGSWLKPWTWGRAASGQPAA